jgi:hypothetical protein
MPGSLNLIRYEILSVYTREGQTGVIYNYIRLYLKISEACFIDREYFIETITD